MVAGERRAPVFQYLDQASIGDERRHHVFHHERQPRAVKGGLYEQVHVIQDEGATDMDVDAASVALELPGIEAAGGRQASAARGAEEGTSANDQRRQPVLRYRAAITPKCL
jgi:hypothetical protein